jgi:FkbM family methyltransferase
VLEEFEMAKTLKCKIVYNKYGGYCIPDLYLPHCNAARDLSAGKVYESHTIKYLVPHCGKGDVIHAGAYIGDFLPAISDSLAPGAILWTFEPNPKNYLCATITKYVNQLDNVKMYKAGLGEKSGSALMKTLGENGAPMCGMSKIVEDGNETVKMMTIDEVIPSDRNITLLHLDVEGYEAQALLGASKTIHRCEPVIILETLSDEDWLLNAFGYKVVRKVGRNSVLTKVKT